MGNEDIGVLFRLNYELTNNGVPEAISAQIVSNLKLNVIDESRIDHLVDCFIFVVSNMYHEYQIDYEELGNEMLLNTLRGVPLMIKDHSKSI